MEINNLRAGLCKHITFVLCISKFTYYSDTKPIVKLTTIVVLLCLGLKLFNSDKSFYYVTSTGEILCMKGFNIIMLIRWVYSILWLWYATQSTIRELWEYFFYTFWRKADFKLLQTFCFMSVLRRFSAPVILFQANLDCFLLKGKLPALRFIKNYLLTQIDGQWLKAGLGEHFYLGLGQVLSWALGSEK